MPCFNDCTASHRRQVFVLQEKKMVARFNNKSKDLHKITKFDGCVDCVGKRADFIVANEKDMQVIVELKGRDIVEAGKQIENTFQYLKQNGLLLKINGALVVCSKVPLGVSSVQKLILNLRSNGIKSVKVKTREWVGTLSELTV